MRRDNIGARLYRQSLNIPYINRSDSRMIPNTFEAYMFGRQNTAFQFGVGHVTKIKVKNSDRFVPMAEAAGAEGGEEAGEGYRGVEFRRARRGSRR